MEFIYYYIWSDTENRVVTSFLDYGTAIRYRNQIVKRIAPSKINSRPGYRKHRAYEIYKYRRLFKLGAGVYYICCNYEY